LAGSLAAGTLAPSCLVAILTCCRSASSWEGISWLEGVCGHTPPGFASLSDRLSAGYPGFAAHPGGRSLNRAPEERPAVSSSASPSCASSAGGNHCSQAPTIQEMAPQARRARQENASAFTGEITNLRWATLLPPGILTHVDATGGWWSAKKNSRAGVAHRVGLK
jgi:hypothetical protein